MNAEQRSLAWIDKEREQIIGFLQDLVRIPSVTGDEGKIQRFIVGTLARL